MQLDVWNYFAILIGSSSKTWKRNRSILPGLINLENHLGHLFHHANESLVRVCSAAVIYLGKRLKFANKIC